MSLAIQANDADGDTLNYAASGLPAGLSINSSGVISGTPSTAGNYTVTVTVDDGEDSVSTSFSWTIMAPAPPPNTAPTLSSPGPQVTEVWQDVALTITASDANGDPLNYSASGLPTGLSINSSTGVVSGAPSATGNHTVTVTVDDGRDSVSASFSWIVSVSNTPPTLGTPLAQSNDIGDSISFTMQASDADGDSLSFTASGLPAGLTINSSGVITGTLTAAGNHSVTVIVDDGEDSASVTFSWSVRDSGSANLGSASGGGSSGGGSIGLIWLFGLLLFGGCRAALLHRHGLRSAR